MQEDIFVSSHDGLYVRSRGKSVLEGIRNSYEIWKTSSGFLYVKMKILEDGEEIRTIFDYDDLENVKKDGRIWYSSQGYATQSGNNLKLHNLIMNFTPNGSFPGNTIDHINRNKLDNRKINLRIATMKEQLANQKGKVEGTKRDRQCMAIRLPDGINQEDMCKYVSYRKETYKEYFVIEDHPLHLNKITINNKCVKKHIKSVQAQWKNQYSDPKIPYPVIEKLNEIKEKIKKLDELFKIWESDNTIKNIDCDDIISDSFTDEIRVPQNTKKIYKFDENNIFVEEYDSIVEAAKKNNYSEKTISRAIKTNILCRGFYYKTKIQEMDHSLLGQTVNA
jgi:hypothetical protein